MKKLRRISDKERLHFLLGFNREFKESYFNRHYGWEPVRTTFFPFTIKAIDAAIRAGQRGNK